MASRATVGCDGEHLLGVDFDRTTAYWYAKEGCDFCCAGLPMGLSHLIVTEIQDDARFHLSTTIGTDT
ncbi:hypothetical protein GC163_02540 [bacterium]|nr:hypothetical protein [bacterium]